MRVEDIALRLRRRSPWEALDLGHAMLRAWARRIYGAWFATYWPTGLVLYLLLWPWPEYVPIVLWWLKPLFDRVLLLVYSRAVFGAECRVRDVLRALPRLFGRTSGVVSSLTLFRCGLARSFLLPIRQLEEQQGADARARGKLLSRRGHGHAVWLTLFCANMSSILAVALLLTCAVLIPGDGRPLEIFPWFSDEWARGKQGLLILAYMLAETLVEPLYVASGFSLYLNRRSELEAWDIELGLRRLADRCLALKRANVLPLCSMAVLCGLLWSPPVTYAQGLVPAAWNAAVEEPAVRKAEGRVDATVETDDSEQPSTAPPSRRRPRTAVGQAIDTVLADPVFGRTTDDWTWRWRDAAVADDDDRSPALEILVKILNLVADVGERLVWIFAGLAAAAVCFLVVRHRRRPMPTIAPEVPEFLLGVDLRPASLPTDIASAARAALVEGRGIDALSLLYRGALRALVERCRVRFAAGDTEGDCLRRAADRLSPAACQCFGAVVDAWRRAAYGRLPIEAATLENLIAYWEAYFSPSGAPP